MYNRGGGKVRIPHSASAFHDIVIQESEHEMPPRVNPHLQYQYFPREPRQQQQRQVYISNDKGQAPILIMVTHLPQLSISLFFFYYDRTWQYQVCAADRTMKVAVVIFLIMKVLSVSNNHHLLVSIWERCQQETTLLPIGLGYVVVTSQVHYMDDDCCPLFRFLLSLQITVQDLVLLDNLAHGHSQLTNLSNNYLMSVIIMIDDSWFALDVAIFIL